MTNTCRQVIQMIKEKNKKSLILPKSVIVCAIIAAIGIAIGIYGYIWGSLGSKYICIAIGAVSYIASVAYGSKQPKNIDDPVIQNEIKEEIILGLQKMNLNDRKSIKQLKKEILRYQETNKNVSTRFLKGCSAIFTIALSTFLQPNTFGLTITNPDFTSILILILCFIVVVIGYYMIIYSVIEIFKEIIKQYNKYEIAYKWLEEIKYVIK